MAGGRSKGGKCRNRSATSSRRQLVDTYGVDPVRYFMLRELPFGSDGDFSHRAVVGRLNGDLANDFGNLAQRVLVMINRDCDARVPEPGTRAAVDQALLAAAQRPSRHRAQAYGRAGVSSGARDHLAGRRRGQPLCRRAGAVGVAAQRSGADAHRALYPCRDDPASRDSGATLCARRGGEASRPARGAGGVARFRGAAATPLVPGARLPKPEGIFPRFVEAPAA